MTRPARRVHFWIWALLGPIVILLFFASIRLIPVTVTEDPEVVERLRVEPN